MPENVMIHTATGKIEVINDSDFREILRRANDWYNSHGEDKYMQSLIAVMIEASLGPARRRA